MRSAEAAKMVCHYFQAQELAQSQMVQLTSMLDGMVVGASALPPAAHMQTSVLQRLELTPAQVEQLCAECDSVSALLEVLAKRLSGADPTHANPLAAHVQQHGPAESGGAGSGLSAGAGSVAQVSRKASGLGVGGSTTVTVTKTVGQEAPLGASRLASSGRAFSDGGTLCDNAVQSPFRPRSSLFVASVRY
jgi:hypothetical protein